MPPPPDDLAATTAQALTRLAKSVVVLTAHWRGQRLAMTATAVEGLTADPPSMLVCLARNASMAAPLLGRAPFAINLLAGDQAAQAARGVAPWRGEERFALGGWNDDPATPPLLAGAQASLVCTPDVVHDYHTHHLVIATVDAVQVDDGPGGRVDPLIYAGGGYRTLGPAAVTGELT